MRPTSPGKGRLANGRLAPAALALAAAFAVAAGSAPPGSPRAEPARAEAAAKPDAGAEGRLSDERRVTYWAFARTRAKIREQPDPGSPAFATVRLATELGAPEVYLVLRRSIDPAGGGWLQVRVPMRPNGQVGWVSEDALGALQVTYTRLVISLAHRRARLFESGSPIWSAPVGIGEAGTPTPRGHFYVRERLHLGGRGGAYGSFAFGTSAYSSRLSDWPGGGVVGVHGTNEPRLIPGRISHGCVRIRNPEIRDLRQLMGLGTPIWIH